MTPLEATALTELTRQLRSISDEKLDVLAKTLKWGTYGPNGDGELKVKSFSELDTEHLENIVITQPITELQIRVILHILKKRYVTQHDYSRIHERKITARRTMRAVDLRMQENVTDAHGRPWAVLSDAEAKSLAAELMSIVNRSL